MPLRTLAHDLPPTAPSPMRATPRRLAFLIESLNGGGVQRMTLAMSGACAARGHAVDLLVLDQEGDLKDAVPDGVRLVPLTAGGRLGARLLPLLADPGGFVPLARMVLLARRTDPTFAFLGSLARHLRREAPDALITGTRPLNLLAVWARRLAGTSTRVLLSERTAPSQDLDSGNPRRRRLLPAVMGHAYAKAEVVVAVSNGVADDLSALTGLPRHRVRTIYNPVVGPELEHLARQPAGHPWLAPGEPPVVLSVGRLATQKDFPTLIRAFARLRAERPLRLIILGAAARPAQTAERTAELCALATDLGVAADIDLPGFCPNPYAFMARSSLFVLSSAWEGFGNVLVEAMACGCPVVSTDCPSGPAEILDGGRYGALVPVGDDAALAQAMARTLDRPPDRAVLQGRAGEFTVGRATDAYLAALFDG